MSPTEPSGGGSRRGRVLDLLLLIAAILGALWLAALVYHNHLGGHVDRTAPEVRAVREAIDATMPPAPR